MTMLRLAIRGGVLTVLFMLLTLSVASQLLARAASMSGPRCVGSMVTIRCPGCWAGEWPTGRGYRFPGGE
jgi:hypothetical protein